MSNTDCDASNPNGNSCIDRQLERAAQADRYNYKVLLLGAGESGKSTFSKQLRLIHKQSISDREKEASVVALRYNVLDCMFTLLEAMEHMEVEISNPALISAANSVKSQRDGKLSQSLARDVQNLWKDKSVQIVWAQRHKFYHLDTSPFYFNEAHRFADPNYEITEEDLIMSRMITTGVKVATLPDPPFEFNVVDVGGQRNERKKWIHIFDDVKAIVFVVNLAGYNQVMFEDATKNRMKESLELFEQVVSNPLFQNVHIFLLLNKKDVFEAEIKRTSLKTCFPEYDGAKGDVIPAINFIEGKFSRIMAEAVPGKALNTCVMAARVRMECRQGWNDIIQVIKGSQTKGGKLTLSRSNF